MRLSTLFGKTLRDTPAGADLIHHQLALRAALVRPAGSGLVSYLPLGWRVHERLWHLLADQWIALGGQEMHLPLGGDSVLAQGREIASYRDLPKLLYHRQVHVHDEPRPGGGLFGLRQVITAEAQSLHATESDLDAGCVRLQEGVGRALGACGVGAVAAEAGPGSHDFILTHARGGEVFLRCDACGYAATLPAAEFRLDPCEGGGDPAPLEKVATPDCPTIAALALYLNLPKCQTLKAVLYTRQGGEFVFAIVRGDLEVNEDRLRAALGGGPLGPASEAEIVAAGAVPGYASPRGLRVAPSPEARSRRMVTVIVDRSVEAGSNYAAGANEAGYHFVNVNYPRDFAATMMADFALAFDGARCGRCDGGRLRQTAGATLASCRRLGATGSTFLDAGGRPQPILVGACRVELDRLLAAVIEQHHDAAGIIWPEEAAPFDVHLLKLGKAAETAAAAEGLYADLQGGGRSVLYDEREESAGVKFADADLIGAPLRLTVSDKSLKAGGVELKRRGSTEKEIVGLEALRSRL